MASLDKVRVIVVGDSGKYLNFFVTTNGIKQIKIYMVFL